MKLNQIYPVELFEQEMKKKNKIGNAKNGLVIQVGSMESFDLAYQYYFYTNRQPLLSGVEGAELIRLCESASGIKIFRELFLYLSSMRKKGVLPAYLDIVMCDGEYKEQVKQAYGQTFTIWEQHKEGYRLERTIHKPPNESKSNAVYILQTLQAIEEYMYLNHKAVSKFSQKYMQTVREKRGSKHGKRHIAWFFKGLSGRKKAF